MDPDVQCWQLKPVLQILFAKPAYYVAADLVQACALIFRQEIRALSLHCFFKGRPSWKQPRDIIAWQIQFLEKRFGICTGGFEQIGWWKCPFLQGSTLPPLWGHEWYRNSAVQLCCLHSDASFFIPVSEGEQSPVVSWSSSANSGCCDCSSWWMEQAVFLREDTRGQLSHSEETA